MYALNEEAVEFPFILLRILYSLMSLKCAFTHRLCLYCFYLWTLSLQFPRQSILHSFSWQKDQIPYHCPINNFIVGTQIWKEVFLILYEHTHTYTNNFCPTELHLHMADLHMLFYTAVLRLKRVSTSKSENKHACDPASLNIYSVYFSFLVQVWPLQWAWYLLEYA